MSAPPPAQPSADDVASDNDSDRSYDWDAEEEQSMRQLDALISAANANNTENQHNKTPPPNTEEQDSDDAAWYRSSKTGADAEHAAEDEGINMNVDQTTDKLSGKKPPAKAEGENAFSPTSSLHVVQTCGATELIPTLTTEVISRGTSGPEEQKAIREATLARLGIQPNLIAQSSPLEDEDGKQSSVSATAGSASTAYQNQTTLLSNASGGTGGAHQRYLPSGRGSAGSDSYFEQYTQFTSGGDLLAYSNYHESNQLDSEGISPPSAGGSGLEFRNSFTGGGLSSTGSTGKKMKKIPLGSSSLIQQPDGAASGVVVNTMNRDPSFSDGKYLVNNCLAQLPAPRSRQGSREHSSSSVVGTGKELHQRLQLALLQEREEDDSGTVTGGLSYEQLAELQGLSPNTVDRAGVGKKTGNINHITTTNGEAKGREPPGSSGAYSNDNGRMAPSCTPQNNKTGGSGISGASSSSSTLGDLEEGVRDMKNIRASGMLNRAVLDDISPMRGGGGGSSSSKPNSKKTKAYTHPEVHNYSLQRPPLHADPTPEPHALPLLKSTIVHGGNKSASSSPGSSPKNPQAEQAKEDGGPKLASTMKYMYGEIIEDMFQGSSSSDAEGGTASNKNDAGTKSESSEHVDSKSSSKVTINEAANTQHNGSTAASSRVRDTEVEALAQEGRNAVRLRRVLAGEDAAEMLRHADLMTLNSVARDCYKAVRTLEYVTKRQQELMREG